MRCRACRRPLTNEISRRYGFGPDCLRRSVAAGTAPLESLELMAAYVKTHKSRKAKAKANKTADQSTGDLFDKLRDAAIDDLHRAAETVRSFGVSVALEIK